MKNRPIRTCLGCGGKFRQSELVRFFWDAHGLVLLDPVAKAHGRGGYFCRNRACLQAVLANKKRLARAFRRKIIDGVAVDPLEIEKLLGSGSFR